MNASLEMGAGIRISQKRPPPINQRHDHSARGKNIRVVTP